MPKDKIQDINASNSQTELSLSNLEREVRACKICAMQFIKTETSHKPRPIFWVSSTARILIVGQAPGARVHESGVPFSDASGDRLREWMAITQEEFYDRSRIAILPMAFCFPGYDKNGSDLPPPKICAKTWRQRILSQLTNIKTTLLVGSYSQFWHLELKAGSSMTKTVINWYKYAPQIFPLPHPSWRNTGWLKQNPWFSLELLPELRRVIHNILYMDDR